MDSLLYLQGAAEGEDEDEDEDEEDEEPVEAASSAAAAPSSIDYAALSRAGYKSATTLTETATYRRLGEEAKEAAEAAEAAAAAAAEAEAARKALLEERQRELLDTKKIDERLGYKKRYDETKEDFRSKEKRKRAAGQQSSAGDYVQEEKRRLRHGSTNFDS